MPKDAFFFLNVYLFVCMWPQTQCSERRKLEVTVCIYVDINTYVDM